MDIVEFREFCLSLPNVEETLPFDDSMLVYKVGGRMFAMGNIDRFDRFAVKCDVERGVLLCEEHAGIAPAWHMNKRHWIDVHVERDVDDALQRELICDSYMLVIRRNVSPASLRERLVSDALREGIRCDVSE